MAGDTTSSTTVHTKRGVCLAYCSDYLGSGEFYSDSPIFTDTALDYYLLLGGGDGVVVGGVHDTRPPVDFDRPRATAAAGEDAHRQRCSFSALLDRSQQVALLKGGSRRTPDCL